MHIGCGPKRKDNTTRGFNNDAWHEIRLDIDPLVFPDVTGSVTDMGAVASASVQGIFSSHNIEHLYPHEVPAALAECLRVLSNDGFAVITCPDLQSVCTLMVYDQLNEAAYTSLAGPIAPLDMLYGCRRSMAEAYMAHRCGFTRKVLRATLQAAGFASVATLSRAGAPFFDVWAIASKSARSDADMRALGAQHFP